MLRSKCHNDQVVESPYPLKSSESGEVLGWSCNYYCMKCGNKIPSSMIKSTKGTIIVHSNGSLQEA